MRRFRFFYAIAAAALVAGVIGYSAGMHNPHPCQPATAPLINQRWYAYSDRLGDARMELTVLMPVCDYAEMGLWLDWQGDETRNPDNVWLICGPKGWEVLR